MKPQHQDNVITLAIHGYGRYRYCIFPHMLSDMLFDQIVLTCKAKNTVAILLDLASYISHSPDMLLVFVSFTYQKYQNLLRV